MSRSTTKPSLLHGLAAVSFSATAGAAAALILTACSPGSTAATDDPAPQSSPAPQGLLTEAAAEKIVDTFQSVNNRANAVRDAKLLGTVEAGQVYEQDSADYKLFKTWPTKEQKTYTQAFTYEDREYLIPPASSGANWFAVTSSPSDDPKGNRRSLAVFDKVGDTYKLVMALWTDMKSIPKIDTDRHGFISPVDPAKKVGTLAPNEISAVYEDFFETGGKTASHKLASTPTTKESVRIYKVRNDGDAGTWSTTRFFAADPAHPKVYALRLENGGVLALVPTAHTEEQILKPAYMGNFLITPSKREAVFGNTRRTVITNEYQGQAIVELPRTGKPLAHDLEYQLVDSR
ncbi:hypothetical protein ACGF14_26485 [Streptomyces althioticus]|uniref:hypothetical protein n=1 Tax=Streptomyces althioticus TaxID=83380 RepID=UPI00371F080D